MATGLCDHERKSATKTFFPSPRFLDSFCDVPPEVREEEDDEEEEEEEEEEVNDGGRRNAEVKS